MAKQREKKKTQNEEMVTRDKNAFSGQTKGDRRILRLITDHFEANPWITTVEQASETRHSGGHLAIICPKATRNSNMFFPF